MVCPGARAGSRRAWYDVVNYGKLLNSLLRLRAVAVLQIMVISSLFHFSLIFSKQLLCCIRNLYIYI